MTKTITPQEALVHFQALWPWASSLHKGRSVGEVVLRGENPGDVTRIYSQAIDWPEGVDRWPTPEPAEQWVEAVWPDAHNKECKWNCLEWNQERIGVIVGYVHGDGFPWIVLTTDKDLMWVDECQVRVEPKPTGKDCLTTEDGWLPMDSAPKDVIVELLMGGRWLRGSHSEGKWVSHAFSAEWDLKNQPTAWRETK
jgi:hypothetical protein